VVRTQPSQGWYTGSTPVRAARPNFIGDMARFTPRFLQIDDSLMTKRHIYEVRPRKDKRGVDLVSDALPFGRLWYDGPNALS
jgi:hypothetical protein